MYFTLYNSYPFFTYFLFCLVSVFFFVHQFCLITHTQTRLMALFLGLPGWASTRKVKPIWILLKQETVIRSGISLAICKFASRSRQTTMPAPHHSVVTGRIPFLSRNQKHWRHKHWRHTLFDNTHTHPFNGPFSRTTRVGRYQKGKTNLDFALGGCRISPPRFLAECCKRQLNQVSLVLLYFRLSAFCDLY